LQKEKNERKFIVWVHRGGKRQRVRDWNVEGTRRIIARDYSLEWEGVGY